MAPRAFHYLLLGTTLLTKALVADDSTPINPQGSAAGEGWDLSTLNCAASEPTGKGFVFPETSTTVRLYLIDTAIDNSSGWFDDNPILSVGASQLIRGSEDPTTSSAFNHGTQVLSIIAGPEAGVARGTTIEVVSFDIYPQGEESASSVALLASAVGEAINFQLENPNTPALICIANGSGVPASSTLLESRISEAVARGIPVVVAAGNDGASASQYVPAAYGSMPGVICVGAIDETNNPLSSSNHGSAVDLHAPGLGIGSLHPNSVGAGQTTFMTGTSPATGIVAGLALAELGRQPGLSPAQLENLLKDNSHSPDETQDTRIVQQDNDFDDDGSPDELERLFGYDPLDPQSTPPAINLVHSQEFTSIHLTVASELLDESSPHRLNDGSEWRLQCSTDFSNWTEVDGFTDVGETSFGQTPITIVDATVHEVETEVSEPDSSNSPEPTGDDIGIEAPDEFLIVYVLLGFTDDGEPILEKVDPVEASPESTLLEAPTSRARCFYRVAWTPARLVEQ